MSIGHLVMLHGCTIARELARGHRRDRAQPRGDRQELPDRRGRHGDRGQGDPRRLAGARRASKVVRSLTAEEIATNTWIAEHYVERAARYRQGLEADRMSREPLPRLARGLGAAARLREPLSRSTRCAFPRPRRSPRFFLTPRYIIALGHRVQRRGLRAARHPRVPLLPPGAGGGRHAILKALGLGAAFSFLMEVMQLFVPNRVRLDRATWRANAARRARRRAGVRATRSTRSSPGRSGDAARATSSSPARGATRGWCC